MPRLFSRLVLVVLALCVATGEARADKVDRLIAQLQKSRDYKVRLSAALNLAKLRDKRAIPAFMRALSDRDKTVRGVSAAALGKVVDGSVSEGRRKQVLSALARAARKDSNSFVRKQAQKAYKTVKAISADDGGEGGGKIYVDVGNMASKARGAAAMKALMRKTALETLSKKASSMRTKWPGRRPTKRQLSKGGYVGFHVDGTLTELATTDAGGGTRVSCKVSMLLATYPDKSMFGFLNGGAQVQASSSEREVEYAKQDCVAAVVEDLIARKIVPTIKVRAR